MITYFRLLREEERDAPSITRRLVHTIACSGLSRVRTELFQLLVIPYRMVRGKVRRNRERLTVLGLNDNHNHDLKNLFKGAAISASTRPGPLYDFYGALLEKGMRPTMARLTLARKIATITLTIWKKGVDFDAQQLNRQAA